MPKLVIFKTNESEVDLFLRLSARGRQPDIPYYQSVESYDVADGTVIFRRLDCRPAQPYKVGCAGGCFITTESFAQCVELWLLEWNIPFQREVRECDSPAQARQILTTMRSDVKKKERSRINRLIAEGLKLQRERLDAVLLSEK